MMIHDFERLMAFSAYILHSKVKSFTCQKSNLGFYFFDTKHRGIAPSARSNKKFGEQTFGNKKAWQNDLWKTPGISCLRIYPLSLGYSWHLNVLWPAIYCTSMVYLPACEHSWAKMAFYIFLRTHKLMAPKVCLTNFFVWTRWYLGWRKVIKRPLLAEERRVAYRVACSSCFSMIYIIKWRCFSQKVCLPNFLGETQIL